MLYNIINPPNNFLCVSVSCTGISCQNITINPNPTKHKKVTIPKISKNRLLSDFCLSLILLSVIYSSPNVKLTGTVYCARTGRPFCIPGVHFGERFNTRIASSCIAWLGPRIDFISVKLPSLSTTN